ncbi:hypothetical protein [Nonomuraea rubra]|uniref:hypothetical protein n=1 Tax=Nonomuraea rubra TaxID=46180 RepID=UPI0033F0267B
MSDKQWTPRSVREALGETGLLRGVLDQNLGHAIIRVVNDAETQTAGGAIARAYGEGGIFIAAAALDAGAADVRSTESAEQIRQGLRDSVLVIDSVELLQDLLGLTPALVEWLVLWHQSRRFAELEAADGTSSLDEQRAAIIARARELGLDVVPRADPE